MSVSNYGILTKLAESSAAEALRSAKFASSLTLSPIETARRIVEHNQRANDLSIVAKSMPSSTSDKQAAAAAVSANAAASSAHTAAATVYQLITKSDKVGSDVNAITEQLKTAESSRLDAQKYRDTAATLRSGLATATDDVKALLLAAAHANTAAAACNEMIERISIAGAMAAQESKPTDKVDSQKPVSLPTTDDISKEAFVIFTNRNKEPSEEVAADRDWFEAKANLMERATRPSAK
jgi:hypothetical protein